MDWTAKTVTDEDKEAVQAATSMAINGDPTVVATRLFEVTTRDDYNERIFIVIWHRERAAIEGKHYATHRVCINDNGESMLVIGHYDMDYKTALLDLADRMRYAPAARV